jgi:23S rRNA pseudouridine2605 synthase
MKDCIVAPHVLCYQAALMTITPKRRKGGPIQQGHASAVTGARIAKVIARAGLASRREAEAWIAAGRIAVNGTVITSPAVNVGPRDAVSVDGRPLPQRERTRLFLFHKPRGLVTSSADPEGRPTIFGALPKELPRLISVGRLDLNTEGLLLLTNDGGLARVLELPDTGWLRRYRVRAHGTITQAALDALRDGVTIEGMHYGPIEATLDRVQGANVWLTFAIREGKNREVRNVLEHLGLQVNRLIRLSFGPCQLGALAEGAINEVKTRTLQEQLGPRVAAQAGADFDAPVRNEKRTALPIRRPDERDKRVSKDNGRRRGGASDEGRLQRPPQNDGERPSKPRPWRGRNRERPIDAPASEDAGPRKSKAGLLTDRRGRRVLVERFEREQSPKPEQRERSAGRIVKPNRRPRWPDRAGGPRPSRPRGGKGAR